MKVGDLLALPVHAESLFDKPRSFWNMFITYDVQVYSLGYLVDPYVQWRNVDYTTMLAILKVWERSELMLDIKQNRWCRCGICCRLQSIWSMDWDSYDGKSICAECAELYGIRKPQDHEIIFADTEETIHEMP